MTQGERDPLEGWPEFSARVRARLEGGRVAYGDRSFSADPAHLLEEIQAELLDVCGWSYILFERIDRVRQALTTAPAEPSSPRVPGAAPSAESPETRERIQARRAAAKAERAASVSAARDAITRLHPDIEARKLEGLTGDVLSVQSGTAAPLICTRVLKLLGAEHPLLAGIAPPKQSKGAERSESRRPSRPPERSITVEYVRSNRQRASQLERRST